jgi:transposase-like protein
MTEHQQLRLQHWRLKIDQEPQLNTRSVSAICRRYHISRETFHKWKEAR